MTTHTDQPFFIVGQPRSGTTLLRMILCSHPRLFIPAETGFLPFLPKTSDRFLSKRQALRLLQHIGHLNREWRLSGEEAVQVVHNLSEPLTMAAVIDALYRRKMAGWGERWGDKSPGYAVYLPQILETFPRAQIIHLIRDGRDAALSALQKWGTRERHLDIYYLVKQWEERATRARAWGSRLDTRKYLEVSYETLVHNPKPAIETICGFLGEPFHPDMLDHTVLSRKVIDSGHVHASVRHPIFTSSVGRWKREMTPFQHKLVLEEVGGTLASFGYELPEPAKMSGKERLHASYYKVKYHILVWLRRGLYTTGVITLNRKKRSGPFWRKWIRS